MLLYLKNNLLDLVFRLIQFFAELTGLPKIYIPYYLLTFKDRLIKIENAIFSYLGIAGLFSKNIILIYNS